MNKVWLAQFMQQHQLPDAFEKTAEQFYWPLAKRLAKQALSHGEPLFVGINGCQGSGKSTLTAFLCAALNDALDAPAVGMSIDDFYLTRAERGTLSRQVHPLLMTRGVPGTHDTGLLNEVITALQIGQVPVLIPQFKKELDDRASPDCWQQVDQRMRVIILEGWCVGTPAQSEAELVEPVNRLEATEDSDALWRRYVNQQLADNYQPLFQRLNTLIMLRAPSFATVHQWRSEQEEKLRNRLSPEQAHRLMSSAELERFISHYQRLTQVSIDLLPAQADTCFYLAADRSIERLQTEGTP